MKKNLFIITTVFIALTMTSCEQDVSITIKDENKTPDITINIYKGDSDTFLAGGKTNNEGVFKDTIEARPNENIFITFDKEGYDIIPGELEEKPTAGTPLTINVSIAAELSGKSIEFIAMNAIPNIQIYGVNKSGGAEKYLGKTNNAGILKTLIKKKDFPNKISFKYDLKDTRVVSDIDISGFYEFDKIPKQINLKAYPDKDLDFYFFCQESFSKANLGEIYIHGKNNRYSGLTGRMGTANVSIHPTEMDGPFIGDVIEWNVKSENYNIPDPVESVISVGVFEYPEQGENNPYNIKLRREYKIPIQVLENDSPVSDVSVELNGTELFKTDENGKGVYKYYEKDMGKKAKFSVKKEGLSANPEPITLGKIVQSITFNVETIHLFLKLVDSQTQNPISGLTINRNGINMGESKGLGSVKIIFPKVGYHTLDISDPNEEYLKKSYRLNIPQDAIGEEYTVEIDPKTGVSFSLIDKKTRKALMSVQVYREGKRVGKTNDLGLYAEDFDPAPGNYYYYSFKADHYSHLDKMKIYRQPGRVKEEIILKKLTTTLSLKDDLGNPVPYVDIYIDEKIVGQSNGAGKYVFSPVQIGDAYSIKIISKDGLYVTKENKMKFIRNELTEHITLDRQSWIELSMFEPGGFPLGGVQVVSSTGQSGLSDSLGIFRYKVLSKIEPVQFSFTKSGFNKISTSIFPKDLVMKEKIAIPRLQAFFYVLDSRTNNPVGNLKISVNGNPQTVTEYSGKANIFPDEKPSDLEIYIDAQDNSYIPIKKMVRYVNNDLGQILIKRRPIEINIFVRWSTGSPIMGSLEIDSPYEKYVLEKKDKGKHTFKLFDISNETTLTIKTLTATGESIEKIYPITMPKSGVFSKDIPIVIETKPEITIEVDPGVNVTVIHRTVTGDENIIIKEHAGDYAGQLPDFGDYIIVRSGRGFSPPDSGVYIIDRPQQFISLKVQPHCQEAKKAYDDGNWSIFINKVDLLTVRDECYCEMNKKAGEVRMEKKDYKNALEYYNNIVYQNTNCIVNKVNTSNDPYIYLRMLECAVESKQYEEGIRAARKFDDREQLLDPLNKAKSICNKDYLLGRLMVNEYWRLCDEKNNAGISKARAIKEKMDEVGKETKNHLERYEKTRGSCPSLQVQLNQMINGCS